MRMECMESPSFREAWEAYSVSQRNIKQLISKQTAEIQGLQATSMEAISTLLSTSESEHPHAALPERIFSAVDEDITKMLHKQQKDIDQLINHLSTIN